MKSFRSEVMVLRDLATVLERNQSIQRPIFEATGDKESPKVEIKFHVWDHTFSVENRRQHVEAEIEAIMDSFPDAEWRTNNPNENHFDRTYYQMLAEWHGAAVSITTYRKTVCEMVVVREDVEEVEEPDPAMLAEAMEGIPLVKRTVKTPVMEWDCNKALAEKVDPILKARKEQADA